MDRINKIKLKCFKTLASILRKMYDDEELKEFAEWYIKTYTNEH